MLSRFKMTKELLLLKALILVLRVEFFNRGLLLLLFKKNLLRKENESWVQLLAVLVPKKMKQKDLRNGCSKGRSQLVKDLHADRLKMVKELDLLRESVKISKSSRNMLVEEAIRLRLLLEESKAFSLKCRGCEDKEATKSSLHSQDDVLN
nr:hypothetical protein [Tanacetum cinerariifolium]